MALLQIAEPGLSTVPHGHRLAAGIDLGTTNSLIASVKSGVAKTIVDDNDHDILPSVVSYQKDYILVGNEAKVFLVNDPHNTIVSAKRLIGRSLNDIESKYPHLPYQFVGNENHPDIQTRQGAINPVQVSSEILKSLVQRAEHALGGELTGVVITVPAYFDDAQRQSTKNAAKLAGVEVLRLLNEPTAAAVAYGLDSLDRANNETAQEEVIAVYDLGGGTFDISILRLNKGVFEVLATGGDSALGGDDFDLLIVEFLVDKLIEQTNLSRPLSPNLERQLLQQACFAKEQLSDNDSVDIEIDLPENDSFKATLSKTVFNGLAKKLVSKTLRACKRAMRDAQVSIENIMEVVMVGGSTRVPLVRSEVENYFKRQPLTSIDPDKVVAIGAAIQADILAGNNPDSDILLLDVIPLSLGIETMGGLVEKIIPRNTTIPVAKAQEFTTFKEGQTAMAIQVLQGERELVDDCRSLARFELRGIPPMTAGAAHIRVTFKVDADGLLDVTAMEKTSKVSANIEVKPTFGLQESQITQMLKDSMNNAEQDMQARMLKEQQVEAKRVLESVQSALAADGDLLTEQARNDIGNALVNLVAVTQNSNGSPTGVKDIEEAIETVDKLTGNFAELRMDSSIRQALAGHNVDDI